MSAFRLVPAESGDLGYVEWLLQEAGLPRGDIRDDDPTFYLATVDGDPVGVGGMEHHGNEMLLRSVVIETDERGAGHGRALVEGLLDRTPADATAAYLLTTDASDFFAKLGFERVEREEVPAPIRETRQFTEDCPSSATCMWRKLESTGA